MSVVRTLIGNVKGPKGDTGSQGPQGVAGTIEIGSVQTVGYGSPASVTNSGTEEEAILDFQIPQGAPGETVSDMSNLTLQTITDSTADYPTYAVGETGATIFGKIRKFLSDLKSKYVSKSMMSTSTNISTPGEAVADAVAIKSLNDAFENSKHDTATIPANSTTTISVDFTVNAFRLLCIGHNSQAGLRGIYILRGTQTPIAIIPAASITLSNPTATSIDVTNGTGYTASAIVV